MMTRKDRGAGADALFAEGVRAHGRGRLREAAILYRKAVQARPDLADAHYNLAIAVKALGRLEEAAAAYGCALALRPEWPEALGNLANVLNDLGRRDEAAAAWDRALALRPDWPEGQCSRGALLLGLGRPAEAAAACRRALALRPDFAAAHCNLAHALRDVGAAAEAIRAYGKAVDLDPTLADAHAALGHLLLGLGKWEEALAAYRRAAALRPRHAPVHANVGNALRELGRVEAAIAAYRQAVTLDADFAEAFAQLVQLRRHACDWGGLAADEARLLDLARRGRIPVTVFPLLAGPASAADQLHAARRWAAALPSAPAPEPRPAAGRIRLGYLSSDFRDHPVATLVAELFERHDRAGFEVFGYSIGPDDGSPLRRRLEAAFDRFADLEALSDGDAADRIGADGVDILVDLNGYTRLARTGILARRPAPVQVEWLGYPGTMGADFIDWAIVDPVVAPAGDEAFFSERLVRLPHSYQPTDTTRRLAESPPRALAGLPEAGFVFCCFNTAYKLGPALFDIWMRLLAAVPGSVLWLLEGAAPMPANLKREAAARGVDPQRLVFAPRLPAADHLARHRCADLFLDTLPYNAHTTASDALWAGLPVLTCKGPTFAGRVAASLLEAAGLPDLVTQSLAAYESLALSLAQQPDLLAELRRRLEENRAAAPLFDTARFARDIEAAYRSMVR